MNTKKYIFLAVIFLALGFASQTLAARMVPVLDPLQPMPEGTGPNVSNNINTPSSEINTNLEEQNQPTDATAPNPEDTTAGTDQLAAVTGDVPTSSSTWYWSLLFVGLAGILAAGIWGYLRFVRKQF